MWCCFHFIFSNKLFLIGLTSFLNTASKFNLIGCNTLAYVCQQTHGFCSHKTTWRDPGDPNYGPNYGPLWVQDHAYSVMCIMTISKYTRFTYEYSTHPTYYLADWGFLSGLWCSFFYVEQQFLNVNLMFTFFKMCGPKCYKMT